jgi:hypothetical protein
VRDIEVMAMYVAALVHGCATAEGEMGEQEQEQDRVCNVLRDFLDGLKLPPQVAGPAVYMASFVYMSREVPALKILRDALRLDQMGPMSVVRAAKDGKDVLDMAVDVSGMETMTGEKKAQEACACVDKFKNALENLVACGGILDHWAPEWE